MAPLLTEERDQPKVNGRKKDKNKLERQSKNIDTQEITMMMVKNNDQSRELTIEGAIASGRQTVKVESRSLRKRITSNLTR